jgi:hypothetical protein
VTALQCSAPSRALQRPTIAISIWHDKDDIRVQQNYSDEALSLRRKEQRTRKYSERQKAGQLRMHWHCDGQLR